ncbi:unnamed protein product [Dicrocoelium dendriticum]|nr:unnamed protein product [Dicrocoelium dendriticum]
MLVVYQQPVQGSSFFLSLRPPPATLVALCLSGDAASNANQASVGIVLSPRAENALIDWIPVNSRMCSLRLSVSFQASKLRGDERCLFVIAIYASTNSSTNPTKDEFYHQLSGIFVTGVVPIL